MIKIRQGTITALSVSGLLLAGSVYGQESFVVSGPVDAYKDLATGEERNDYTFTATVTYDPAAAPDETYTHDEYEQSFFYETVLSIEYSIYDAEGELVHSGVEHGDQDNVTSTADDIDLSDPLDENMYWHGDDYKSTLTTEANITFYDASGEMISNVQEYPTPPASREAFDYGGGFFYQYNQDTGEGFDAWGSISEVSIQDPVISCLDQARDRRDFRECFRLIVQEIRNDGLTDAQKAKLREVAAGLREARWVKLESLWGADSEKFRRFADKIEAIWSGFGDRIEQWLERLEQDTDRNGDNEWWSRISDWRGNDDRSNHSWWDRGNDRDSNRNNGRESSRDHDWQDWSFGGGRDDRNDRDDGNGRDNDRGWSGLLTGFGDKTRVSSDRNDDRLGSWRRDTRSSDDERETRWNRDRNDNSRDRGSRGNSGWNSGWNDRDTDRRNRRDNERNRGWSGGWSRGW